MVHDQRHRDEDNPGSRCLGCRVVMIGSDRNIVEIDDDDDIELGGC